MTIAAERFAAQMLTDRPATSADEVTERLLAIQAQDSRGARLSVRSRSHGLHSSDVDRALNDRSLIVTWVNRGTLHLVRPEDYWWLHELTTPQLATGNIRRLEQEGVSPQDAERSVAIIEKSLEADGPLTRPQLRERLDAAGIRTVGQALVHQLFLATLRGLVVRGPMVGKEQAFVLVRDWLGRAPRFDRDAALTQLGKRYLAGHGPADDRDLARWAGITLGDARKALTGVGVERADGLIEAEGALHTDQLPPPCLLGSFEPVLLGWTSRAEILGEDNTLVTTNGIFRPFAMIDGRAVGSWGFAGGKVTMTAFRAVSADEKKTLDQEAKDVETFLSPAEKGTA